MSFEGMPTNATSDNSNESQDPWVPLGPLEQSESKPRQEKPKFNDFDTLSEHYGGIDKGSIIKSGGEELNVVDLIDDPEKEGGGFVEVIRGTGDDALSKKMSFDFIVRHQDLIEDVKPVEKKTDPAGEIESDEVINKSGSVETSQEEQPVFTEIPSPALSEEEQIAQFPVPKRDEEKNDNWGEQYMKDYVDKPEQSIDTDAKKEPTFIDTIDEAIELMKKSEEEANNPPVEKEPVTEPEVPPEVLKHKEASIGIINSIKIDGYDFNDSIKKTLSEKIKADPLIQDPDKLQAYLGMMEKDLDYANSVGKGKKTDGRLIRLDLRAHMAREHKARTSSNEFQNMLMDLKFAASLFSKKPWQEIIDTRAEAIKIIKRTAEEEKSPAKKSFYIELAKEYEELNKRDEEWINKKTVLGSIGSGVSKLAEKIFWKEDSKEKKEPVKPQSAHVMRDPDKDPRNSYAQDTLSQAEEDFEQNRGKVKLPEKKKRWQWLSSWWTRK